MTRDEIVSEYTIENGIIRNPGQFEGEMLYVPYFWDAYLNGMADEDDGDVLSFEVSAEDRAMFPEIPAETTVIRLYQRDDGFVCEC